MEFTQQTTYYTNKSGVINYTNKTLGYLFVNTGSNDVVINQLKIPVGSFYNSFSPPFIDRTNYDYQFTVNTGEGAVNNFELMVVEYTKF